MGTVEINYTPMSHQKALHDSTAKRLVVITGRQVGKTVAVVNEIIKRSVIVPNSRNWYVTNDFKQAKRNVWDLFSEFLPRELIDKTNVSDLTFRLKNNSLIELIGVENAESLRGAKVHFMALDEYADFPRRTFPEVLEPMLTTTNGDVWFIGTPKGLGNDLHDRYMRDDHFKLKFPACSIHDNTVTDLLSEYASKEMLQQAYDQDFTDSKEIFSQEYLAEFTRPSGTVYSMWPLDNFKSVPYNDALPLHITLDFGVRDPTAIIWIQPSGGEYRVIDYIEFQDGNAQMIAQIVNSKPYKPVELVTGDDAGNARSIASGTSIIAELRQRGIHTRTTPGLRIPDQIRNTRLHIKSLFVDSKLTRLRDCILNYRYPTLKGTERNQSNEIPIHDEFSHAMRALEYYFINSAGFQQTYVVKPNFDKWRL